MVVYYVRAWSLRRRFDSDALVNAVHIRGIFHHSMTCADCCAETRYSPMLARKVEDGNRLFDYDGNTYILCEAPDERTIKELEKIKVQWNALTGNIIYPTVPLFAMHPTAWLGNDASVCIPDIANHLYLDNMTAEEKDAMRVIRKRTDICKGQLYMVHGDICCDGKRLIYKFPWGAVHHETNAFICTSTE